MSESRRRSSSVPPFLSQDNWLDQAIDEARQRGDFDDLPGHGQPLQIETNDLAPEWDMAFRVLKNAGFTPIWMELGKEIETQTARLRDQLERARRDLAERVTRAQAEANRSSDVAPIRNAADQVMRRPTHRWWPVRPRTRQAASSVTVPTGPDWLALEAERQHLRQEYLARATRLDAKIVEYHRALPDDLWRLQRGRQTPEVAARHFDAACPVISGPDWLPSSEPPMTEPRQR